MTSRPKGGGFCDNSTKALLLKSVTMGESKILKNYVTSFMDVPNSFWLTPTLFQEFYVLFAWPFKAHAQHNARGSFSAAIH
jgi:hypothetical protein